jgi:hypothetical protein
MRGYPALARIGFSLPMGVLLNVATLDEFVRDSAPKANDDF